LESHSTDSLKNVVRGVVVDVLKFIGKGIQTDDITLLSLEYKGT